MPSIYFTLIFNKELGFKSLGSAEYSLKEMALVIPPVFMLLGLMYEFQKKL